MRRSQRACPPFELVVVRRSIWDSTLSLLFFGRVVICVNRAFRFDCFDC